MTRLEQERGKLFTKCPENSKQGDRFDESQQIIDLTRQTIDPRPHHRAALYRTPRLRWHNFQIFLLFENIRALATLVSIQRYLRGFPPKQETQTGIFKFL